MIYRHSYMEKIIPYLDKPVIKVLSGMRRVGKSTILRMLQNVLQKKGVTEANIIFLNLESLEYDAINDYIDLYNYIKSKIINSQPYYIFLDEIQEVTKWEKAINSLFSEKLGDIIITGSNAHLLSTELATYLTGRYIEFSILPLTFNEFRDFRKENQSSHNVLEDFQDYLKFGGLPGIHELPFNEEGLHLYLNSILNNVLYNDIVKRYNIRDIANLERIVHFVFDNCGNITTSKKISDYLKSQRVNVSVDTVQNYLSYLKSAFLIYNVRKYDLKGKRYLEFADKYYIGDIGLRFGLIGYRDKDISGVLENIVYLELLHRGYQISFGTFDTYEIDFIAEKQNEKCYFQVCYLLSNETVIQREFGNLEKIKDNYPKYVLSLDQVNFGNRDGIKHLNLIDFLTNT